MIWSLRFWARMAAINAAAALTVGFAFNGVTLHTPLAKAAEIMGISFLFSSIISSMCAVTISAIAPALFRRVRFPFNWSILIAVLVGIAAIGSLLALLVLTAIGYLKSREIFVEWFAGTLKVSVIITLVFGIFGTLMELMQVRLNDATVKLRTKERDEAEARRLAAEAQLASIESRVQPHFLFNTLNSIAALVHDDPAGAERMTGQLAALLRSALDSTAVPLVPLDQELRVVRAYLDIERVRFGERLRYDVNLGEGTESATVPRMALQTLVENSVKYAVSPRREGGSICVTAARDNGRVRITVEDDGPGFNAAHRPEGHGLALLDARLAMLFGDRATMRVDSRNGHTGVTLDVPSESAIRNPQPATRNPQSAI
jgi:sensor histidine kinase YesM